MISMYVLAAGSPLYAASTSRFRSARMAGSRSMMSATVPAGSPPEYGRMPL
jgi:hypothetical protein